MSPTTSIQAVWISVLNGMNDSHLLIHILLMPLVAGGGGGSGKHLEGAALCLGSDWPGEGGHSRGLCVAVLFPCLWDCGGGDAWPGLDAFSVSLWGDTGVILSWVGLAQSFPLCVPCVPGLTGAH